MRTIFLTLILLLAFTAPVMAQDEEAPASTDEIQTLENSTTETVPEAVVDPDFMVGPFGSMELTDGTVVEITELERLSKYYIYITGKLNGRASTVISLTRLSDLRHWKQIHFQNPKTFTIVNRQDKELFFTDCRIYLGSSSHDSFTFITTNPANYKEEPITIKKSDVKTININQPKPE